MKTRFLKLALLAVFCIGATVTNAQSNLPEETINVVKKLKVVDTKGLSAEDAQTVMKVLNQIKRENSPRVEMLNVYHRGSQMCYPRVELAGMKVEAIPVAEKPLFILLNTYSTGLSPLTMRHTLELTLKRKGFEPESIEEGELVNIYGAEFEYYR